MKPLWKENKTSSLELPSLLVPLRTCQETSNGHDINGPTMYCWHTDQWSRFRAVPVNIIAVSSMLNYLLCKSSLASQIAVRDHMYHNEIYLFSCSLSPVLIWMNSFGTPCLHRVEGNKCHPFNSRRGRLKEPKNVYTIWDLNLIVSSERGVSCSVLFTSHCLYR